MSQLMPKNWVSHSFWSEPKGFIGKMYLAGIVWWHLDFDNPGDFPTIVSRKPRMFTELFEKSNREAEEDKEDKELRKDR